MAVAADGAVAPSRDDPVVAAGSHAIGGPVGEHNRPHPWWTPLRVVLLLVTVAGMLNLVHTAPCQAGAWWSNAAYADLCYSDVPLSYAGSGAAEGVLPYTDTASRYPATTDPAPIAALSWAVATAGRALTGSDDSRDRATMAVADLARDRQVQREAVNTYGVYSMAMLLAMLLIAVLLVRLSGRRPWDGAAFAAAPVLVLSATIGWDLLGVAATVAGVAASARGRRVVAGIWLGTATAVAVWPLVVLVAMLPIAYRTRGLRIWAAVSAVSATVWAAWQLPVLVLATGTWWGTVNHSLDGQVGYGSLWRLATSYGVPVSSALLVGAVVVGLAVVAVAVLGLAVSARRPPRLAQLALLLLVGGLLVWPVYSPQYVLWLLPFAVLARPRWRDLLIWQTGEVFYHLAIWWTLAGATADVGGVDDTYAFAIVVRVAAQLWLVATVARDVLDPRHDPART